jgi:uncharacterized protein (DUF305 family)
VKAVEGAAMNKEHTASHPYAQLALMAFLSFLAMYALMYAMVDRFANVYPHLNQLYMAALMAAPMVVIELVLMNHMYKIRSWNVAAISASLVVFSASFLFIRQQVGITDREFLRSMIPHHAGAILMCEQAPINDAEIEQLCRTIIAGQQSEIAQMKAILKRIQ